MNGTTRKQAVCTWHSKALYWNGHVWLCEATYIDRRGQAHHTLLHKLNSIEYPNQWVTFE